jgi:RimJ/RimL family protein N-acetyltransferase
MGIHLRRTTEADLDFVLAAEQNEENRPFIGSWTREQHTAALSDQDLGHFIVARDIDDRPVGYIILAGLAQIHQSIEFRRVVITDKHKGYGRKTLRLVKKMAFETWHAHRLWLDVRDHNLRARHVYETEGFVIEGVLRECIRTGEGFESLVVMSMLQSEYKEE